MYFLFYVILCIVCVYLCTVLLPPCGYPIAVNKYIVSIKSGYDWSLKSVINRYDRRIMEGNMLLKLNQSRTGKYLHQHFMQASSNFSEGKRWW